jgi:hypothetical protein
MNDRKTSEVISGKRRKDISVKFCVRFCYVINNAMRTKSALYDLRFSGWWLRRMASYGILHRVALVRTDVSEEQASRHVSVSSYG